MDKIEGYVMGSKRLTPTIVGKIALKCFVVVVVYIYIYASIYYII